jgi:hypothetical protein
MAHGWRPYVHAVFVNVGAKDVIEGQAAFVMRGSQGMKMLAHT